MSHLSPCLISLPPHHRHRGAIRRRDGDDDLCFDDEPTTLATRLVRGRVGGVFWRPLDADVADWLAAVDGSVVALICRDAAMLPRLWQAWARERRRDPVVIVGDRGRSGARGAPIRFDGRSDPWPLIERLSAVYCDDAAHPFVALAALAGHPIVTVDGEGRATPRDAPALARQAAADLRANWRYRSPYDGRAWTAGQMVEYLALWRSTADRTAGVGAMLGIARWKRRRIRQFLIGSPDAAFVSTAREAADLVRRRRGAIAIWPSRTDIAAVRDACGEANIWRIEDGFIRSAGLGAALVQPCSIVLDKQGIYYDPDPPGDLATLLATAPFGPDVLARAQSLIETIRGAGATKYNLRADPVDLPADRHRILVAGQVSDDLSVLSAGAGVTMADMVAAARRENPGSFIVYKPHPDVAAGLRAGEWTEPAIAANADLVLAHGDTHTLLEQVDCVHVLSSLLGFEALLRGRAVVVHGRPFYAGWGLTDDRAPAIAADRRHLSLPELVAATLILYPHYVDPRHGLPCTPEQLLAALANAPRRSRLRLHVARLAMKFRNATKRA